jgi:hypothetical protein
MFTSDRGLYISALIHCEGRILVTNDNIIPTVEVDSEQPTTGGLYSDLYWLMKVLQHTLLESR